MIKTKNLTKAYRTEEVETTALNQVSVEIKQGEFVSIMGSSGSGKSTIANLIPRFYDADSGYIKIDDQSIYKTTLNSLRKNISLNNNI